MGARVHVKQNPVNSVLERDQQGNSYLGGQVEAVTGKVGVLSKQPLPMIKNGIGTLLVDT